MVPPLSLLPLRSFSYPCCLCPMDEFEDVNRPRSPTLGELLHGASSHHSKRSGTDNCSCTDNIVGLQSTARFILTFTDLTYSIKNPNKMPLSSLFSSHPIKTEAGVSATSRTLLDSISGEARDGEILAVLGASGSGKSTLIDALANRISRSSLKGTVSLNGARLKSNVLNSISAYIMQDDLLFPMLTVEETLNFAADLRLPRSLPHSAKKVRVNALIDQLGLGDTCNTIIGDEGHRGISGGERRRVSIGTQIVHDPILLFLDEPTSGLDSTSALMIVKVLKSIASNSSIVVMSIHQPSSCIFSLLDQLIILSRGQTIFNGTPEGLPLFLSHAGHSIPEHKVSRAEFALDLIGQLESFPGGTQILIDLNKSSQLFNNVNSTQSAQSLLLAISSRGKRVCGSTFANPVWVEMAVLVRRSFTNSRQQPELLGVLIVTMLVAGFFLSTVFWQLESSPKGVKERLGLFTFAIATIFNICANGLVVFVQERYRFTRETNYKAYRISSYVLATAIVDLPPLVLISTVFGATTFFAAGLAGGTEGLLFYCLVILASFWAGSGFVAFISGVISDVMMGYVAAVGMLAYISLLDGFYIERDRIPGYWIWLHYLSLVKYTYEAVMQNEFGGERSCFVRGVQMFDGTALAEMKMELKERLLQVISEVVGVELTRETCVVTGREVLEMYEITQLNKWECLWVTVAWGFLFRVLFYLALRLGSKNKRK